MVSRYKDKDGDIVVSFSGKWVSWAHTIVAYAAFLGALIVGCWLHYRKIVQNEHYVRYSPFVESSTDNMVGVSRRVVSFCVCDNWRPVSRALSLPALYCHHLRSDEPFRRSGEC